MESMEAAAASGAVLSRIAPPLGVLMACGFLALAAQVPGGAYYTKWIIAVDEDIDPTDGSAPTHGTVTLAAGDSPTNIQSAITLNSEVDLYNNTAIPIDSTPDAQSNATVNSTVTINAVTQVVNPTNPALNTHYGVNAAGDITLSADRGDLSTTAAGMSA